MNQGPLNVLTSSEENETLTNICRRLHNLETSLGEQNKNINTLKDSNEEMSKRVSVLHESVVNKEKIMEARTRICSDRVFLIEAAAGRKDDVYNAIETLFKSSQKTSERLTAVEKSLANFQANVIRNEGNVSNTEPRGEDGERKNRHYVRHGGISQNRVRQAVPPSQIVSHICRELFESVSLPGVRFVGQGTTWLHRYLWVIIHLTTFTISFNYIKESYDTWQNSPVVLSLNNSLTRVADIPFPALTLCSLPSVSRDFDIAQQVRKCFSCTNQSVDGFCQLNDNCTDLDVAALAAAVGLCDCRSNLTSEQIKLMDDVLLSNLTMADEMEIKNRVLPKCDPSRLFLGERPDYEFSCEAVQTTVMEFSDTPVCVTFNSLCPHHLYRDHVVPPSQDQRHVSCKVTESNHSWTTDNMMMFTNKNQSVPLYRDKKIEIMFKKPEDMNIGTCNEGHDADSKIGLHHPGEVPMEENTRFYSFRSGRDINIYVNPTLITAQKNLRQYAPAVRGCYFSHERNLSLFKFYTRKNCQMECKTNCSEDVCKCIPNFLPRHNHSSRMCHTKEDEYCIRYKLTDGDLSASRHPACFCDCLPDCVSLSYDFSIDDVEIDRRYKATNFTSITIKYKDLEFSSKLRYELRNMADFVADSGGFLGVFNGFSFMVMFELFYFLTIRLWSAIRKSWRLAAEEETQSSGDIKNFDHYIHDSPTIEKHIF